MKTKLPCQLKDIFEVFLIWPVEKIKHSTKNFTSPHFSSWRKVLPKHKFKQVGELAVESNFCLICDFFHELSHEKNWTIDESHKKFYSDLVSNVNWIEVKRENLYDLLSHKLEISANSDYKKIRNQINKKETQILNWFINNRDFFWI